MEAKKLILTGDRPTGNLHLGHYVGVLKSRVEQQHTHNQYILVADVQALTDYYEMPQLVVENSLEVVKDYLAVGIDPQISTILIQSQIPAIAELTIYYMNLVSVSRLERNPTVKNEILQKGLGKTLPVGFLNYPVSQAADITAFGGELVSGGEDQIPMIEQTNEIVRKFNRIYNTNCLKEASIHLSKVPRLVGIDGKAKASKSMNNAIFLSDPPEVIREKVFAMFTDPDHIKVSDPGKVDGNVVFTYLDAFCDDPDEVNSLKSQYLKGGLGDTTLKSYLNDILQKMLQPIREKRRLLTREYILDVCYDGTSRARVVSGGILNNVRNAIGINFFDKIEKHS
ncbi:MAG: tryptophan--tRNA ligase [Holosporaceae bacterium]|jgi:tryptophanyl-tRNA synthetase|nr:tryptophan--tRNA ligase [Holosporaceae bacterium]